MVRGPRDAGCADADALVATSWTASERSNRVGMRLAGGRIEHRDGRPAAAQRGGRAAAAMQVPPSGEPVLFLADHPVTGGYPVIAVVVDADVDRAAQVRPGQPLRFRWVRPAGSTSSTSTPPASLGCTKLIRLSAVPRRGSS